MGSTPSRGGFGLGRAHKQRDSFCMGTADQRNYRIDTHFPYEPVPFTANTNQPTNHTHQRHRRGDWMADYPDTPSPGGSLRVVGPEAYGEVAPALGAAASIRRVSGRDSVCKEVCIGLKLRLIRAFRTVFRAG